MIFLKQFLAVKIADRIQQISRERCTGCAGNYILDNFHECVKTSLDDRIRLYLPKVKAEALDKLDNLIKLYQQAAWAESEEVRKCCADFIVLLTPKDLQDRRYINEDTVELHPLNMSWLLDTPEPAASAPPQSPVKKPAQSGKKPSGKKPSGKKPSKRKLELDEMEEQLLAKFSKIE